MEQKKTSPINDVINAASQLFGSLSILAVLAAAFCMVGCGESGLYTDQANEIIDQIHTILISEKLCDNQNDCAKKQYVLFQVSPGIEIHVYCITDPSIIKKIVNVCMDAHTKSSGITHKLYVYRQTKSEDLKWSSPKKTLLELIMEKEK